MVRIWRHLLGLMGVSLKIRACGRDREDLLRPIDFIAKSSTTISITDTEPVLSNMIENVTSCSTALFSRCWKGFEPLPRRNKVDDQNIRLKLTFLLFIHLKSIRNKIYSIIMTICVQLDQTLVC